jgi:oligosaccharide repeat unit polymerase
MKISANLRIVIVVFIVCIMAVSTALVADSNLYDIRMILLSFFLILLLSVIIVTECDQFSPLIFFSLLFYGYAFSGLYFSFYENIQYAKFFNFAGNFGTQDLADSLISVIVGYIFFVVGYKLIDFPKVKINCDIKGLNCNSSLLIVFLYISFILSFFYWIVVSYVLANGPIDILSNMGIYELLLENNYISTAPYLFAYTSTSLLFLVYLKRREKTPFLLFVAIFLSFIMYLSTARLSGAVFYLLSYPLMYFVFYRQKFNKKIVFMLVFFIALLLVSYVYRVYSNLAYLGLEMDDDILHMLGNHFFGMTNLGDLQSIAFSKLYTSDVGLLFGITFIDFFRGWVDVVADIDLTSVGLRLKEYYFSDVATGAPAPGLISEVIINFGIFGITIFMLIIGVLVKYISAVLNPQNGIFSLFLYAHFLLFLMLLSKVDSSHINHLLWVYLPFYLFAYIAMLVSRVRTLLTY